jgi:hypothetical protein
MPTSISPLHALRICGAPAYVEKKDRLPVIPPTIDMRCRRDNGTLVLWGTGMGQTILMEKSGVRSQKFSPLTPDP